VPEARHALKDLRLKPGEEKATRKFLYSLFPYGYGQQACKIAGMRKPLKLMLDI
jgi:sulfur relay (sulfurtransferase) DsrC/TusE family protein